MNSHIILFHIPDEDLDNFIRLINHSFPGLHWSGSNPSNIPVVDIPVLYEGTRNELSRLPLNPVEGRAHHVPVPPTNPDNLKKD